MLAAHRRWRLWVPAVMAAGAAVVDAITLGAHVTLVGYANYVLVWGSIYQWGFAWRDGTLTRSRWRPWALAGLGAVMLAGLLAWGPFPVDMIGAGERIGNTTPPSIALLSYAAAQAGLVIAAEPLARRFLARPRRQRAVAWLNASVMPAYLWHMVPVLLVSVALYPSSIFPQPLTGSAGWWECRPAWLATLAVTLIVLLAVLGWLLRPLLRLPSGLGPARTWSPAVLVAGLAATMYALTRIAISGIAPGGTLPATVLALLAAGIVLTLLSGGEGPREPRPAAPAPGPARQAVGAV
jgi:hypothetical protein